MWNLNSAITNIEFLIQIRTTVGSFLFGFVIIFSGLNQPFEDFPNLKFCLIQCHSLRFCPYLTTFLIVLFRHQK